MSIQNIDCEKGILNIKISNPDNILHSNQRILLGNHNRDQSIFILPIYGDNYLENFDLYMDNYTEENLHFKQDGAPNFVFVREFLNQLFPVTELEEEDL